MDLPDVDTETLMSYYPTSDQVPELAGYSSGAMGGAGAMDVTASEEAEDAKKDIEIKQQLDFLRSKVRIFKQHANPITGHFHLSAYLRLLWQSELTGFAIKIMIFLLKSREFSPAKWKDFIFPIDSH